MSGLRRWLAIVGMATACLGVDACGQAGGHASGGSGGHAASSAAPATGAGSPSARTATAGSSPESSPKPRPSPAAVLREFALRKRSLPRSDGDDDNPLDRDGQDDHDNNDGDEDTSIPASHRFPDPDDSAALGFGVAVGRAESRAIAGVTERYYAAARSLDARKACSLMTAEVVAGVTWKSPTRRPGETCQTVMSALLEHNRRELADPIEVVDVRVEGVRAEVVLGSRTMPASLTFLRREHGSWLLDQVLGMPLI